MINSRVHRTTSHGNMQNSIGARFTFRLFALSSALRFRFARSNQSALSLSNETSAARLSVPIVQETSGSGDGELRIITAGRGRYGFTLL